MNFVKGLLPLCGVSENDGVGFRWPFYISREVFLREIWDKIWGHRSKQEMGITIMGSPIIVILIIVYRGLATSNVTFLPDQLRESAVSVIILICPQVRPSAPEQEREQAAGARSSGR